MVIYAKQQWHIEKTSCYTFCILTAGILSCSKENTNLATIPPVSTAPFVVKYEFTSNVPAEYRFAYKRDTSIIDEIATTAAWNKTVTVQRSSTSRTARLSVYPPDAWVGTNIQANVNLKVSVDNVLKKDTSGTLAGFDRASGITVQTAF